MCVCVLCSDGKMGLLRFSFHDISSGWFVQFSLILREACTGQRQNENGKTTRQENVKMAKSKAHFVLEVGV